MKLTIDEINWIHTNEYKVHPDFTLDEQAKQLIEYLGSPNSEIREKSLTCLGGSIERGYYSDQQLMDMAVDLEKGILSGLGEQNTDSVFMRSFSVLILGDIIGFDEECAIKKIESRESYLTKENILHFLKISLKYYSEEKDVRGYIPIKEWAHSLAHGADLLRKLAGHRLIGKEELVQILDAFQSKLTELQEDTYRAREEQRIAVAIYTAFLRRLLTTEEIIQWFQGFEQFFKDKKWYNYTKDTPTLYALYNLRSFLYSIYFLVKHGITNKGHFDRPIYKENLLKAREEISNAIEKLILQMDEGLYPTSQS